MRKNEVYVNIYSLNCFSHTVLLGEFGQKWRFSVAGLPILVYPYMIKSNNVEVIVRRSEFVKRWTEKFSLIDMTQLFYYKSEVDTTWIKTYPNYKFLVIYSIDKSINGLYMYSVHCTVHSPQLDTPNTTSTTKNWIFDIQKLCYQTNFINCGALKVKKQQKNTILWNK